MTLDLTQPLLSFFLFPQAFPRQTFFLLFHCGHDVLYRLFLANEASFPFFT